MELTEEQKVLIHGLIEYGVEEEAVPFLMVGLKEPQLTDIMIDFLLDNPQATREDILKKAAELHSKSDNLKMNANAKSGQA